MGTESSAASLYPDWPQYAARLREAVQDLSADALALRAGPEHGTIWQQGQVRQVHGRASVLNRMMSHDAFHAGEISQLLGRHALPPIDLWVARPAT